MTTLISNGPTGNKKAEAAVLALLGGLMRKHGETEFTLKFDDIGQGGGSMGIMIDREKEILTVKIDKDDAFEMAKREADGEPIIFLNNEEGDD